MIGPVAVQARIATIQARISSLSTDPAARGGGVVGHGSFGEGATSAPAATTTRTTTPAAASFRTVASAAAGRATPTSPFTAAGSAASRTAATPGTGPAGLRTGVAAADWATRLPAEGRALGPLVEQAAADNGVRPELLAALVWTESGFRPDAVSPAGAVGLGQLMPGTAAELGVDPRDVRQNLDGAARYLRQQLDRFGDTRLALAAYNAGPGRVADAGGVPSIPETTDYVARVSERARTLGGT